MILGQRSENVNERSYNVHWHKRSENVDIGNITSSSKIEIVTEEKVIDPEAYQSAYDVSKRLAANRLHYHSNFADNQGFTSLLSSIAWKREEKSGSLHSASQRHIDHSAKRMRVITLNRSIKGLQSTNDDVDAHESLASVLDKLLAWEKKLYDEVKAGEVMKLEYQRKVALLNKRKKHGTHSEGLERAKAAVTRWPQCGKR
ncbi:kinesin-like protein [Thalictrum thalictroides]|uniref:Kinesin-like protein n=1 Tax=Thalictrum thalictroides TaxID=46969 RepID=A0A7J6WZ04_THATH|nr:kinesin-like protein [Thalictrum thalictroides]